MENKIEVGLRYCGGCNARYDRVALVKKLESLFPQAVFVPAQPGVAYPGVVLSCGCASNCVTVSDLGVQADQRIYLGGWEHLLPAKKQLEELLARHEALQSIVTETMTHEQVLALLPHRAPMLFVDEVTLLVPETKIEATCYLSPDLPIFAGHFPEEPVFPGVLTVEAVAQTADILMLATTRYAGKTPLFAGIRNATFRKKILPGSTMRMVVQLTQERADFGHVTCQGQVWVQDVLCADVEIRLTFR